MTLPEPIGLPSTERGAWICYGKRKVSWRVVEPGVLHRNAYEMAWFEVVEREPWRGEPLWLSGTRKVGESWREPFTTKSIEKFSKELLPAIAKYGFGRLWTETHREKPDRTEPEIQELEEAVRFHREKAELEEMHRAGLLEFLPLPQDKRLPSVGVPHLGRTSWDRVVGRVMLDGELVGWVTEDSHIVPNRIS